MPSKAELKLEIDNLRQSLKETTTRLSKIEGNPEPKGNPKPAEQEIITEYKEYRIKEYHHPDETIDWWVTDSNRKLLGVYFSLNEAKNAIDTALKQEPEHSSGNPISCAPKLKAIEDNIAGGATYWTIKDSQYERWRKGIDGCLLCEESYVDAKEALNSVGNQYSKLLRPEDVKIEDIAAMVREETGKELFRAESLTKELRKNCGVNFPKTLARITTMKPLAHIGRWSEFLEHRKQLLLDFEKDMKDVIPELEVKMPSYAVPRTVVTPEYERIKAGLTEEERRKLEEREKEQEAKAKVARGVPAGWAVYKCSYCDRRFDTISGMHEHVAKDHPEEVKGGA